VRARKKLEIPKEPSPFTEENMRLIATDLASGRLKVPNGRVQMSDDRVTGLRVMVNKSGLITWHAADTIGESRPLLKIGTFNKGDPEFLTLAEARELTKTIQALARKGTDVQESLHRRLIRELKEKGANWRPA
jgi:hypothetical protein